MSSGRREARATAGRFWLRLRLRSYLRRGAVNTGAEALLYDGLCYSVSEQFAIFRITRLTPIIAITQVSTFHKHCRTASKAEHAKISRVYSTILRAGDRHQFLLNTVGQIE